MCPDKLPLVSAAIFASGAGRIHCKSAGMNCVAVLIAVLAALCQIDVAFAIAIEVDLSSYVNAVAMCDDYNCNYSGPNTMDGSGNVFSATALE